MNKRFILIVAIILSFVLIILKIYSPKKSNENNLSWISNYNEKEVNKVSKHYLKSPWVIENVDWYYLKLPEKWTENKNEFKKNKDVYKEIFLDAKSFEIKLNGFYLMCLYFEAKEGAYENWDLNESVNAVLNNTFYNLKCNEVSVFRSAPFNSPLEAIFSATSVCGLKNIKAQAKSIRFENHILFVGTFYNSTSSDFEIISDRILNGIENKYLELSKIK